jgi:outer membrane protein TolC
MVNHNVFQHRFREQLQSLLRKSTSLLLFATLLTLTQSGLAQETPDALLLSFQRAQELALSENPQIQSAEKSVIQAESQVTGARGRFLPDVSAFGNYTHNFELPVFTIDFGGRQQTLRAGTEENISTGLRLEQPIYMGGTLRSGHRIAEINTEISSNQASLQQQAVLIQVRQSFYRVLYTDQLISVARDAIRNAERNLEIVRRQSELGTASGFDVLRAEVQVANTRPQLIAAEHQHEQALTSLRTAIGLDPDQPIQVQGELTHQESDWTDSSIQSLQKQAFENRYELRNVQMQHQIRQQNLSIARGNLLPKVSASSSWQYQMQNKDIVFDRDKYYRSIAGGINVSVPLFTGWQNRSKVEQAQVALNQVSDTERQLRHQIAAEVESAYYALIQAEEQLISQQETVGQARKALQLAEIRFKEGTSTQLDVLNAQLALQQAQTNESQYLLQYNIARDQLFRAMNLLKIES